MFGFVPHVETVRGNNFQIHRHHLDRENESVHEGIVSVPVLLSKIFVTMRNESPLSHNVVDENKVTQTWSNMYFCTFWSG